MYPGSKYSVRPSSPTFLNFSPSSDYPFTHHHHSLSMKRMVPKAGPSQITSTTTLGGRSEVIFPEDVDTIEFCMHRDTNNVNNLENSFSEKRRRGRSRRSKSNQKLEVEQQVKWTKNNIAATMERFEPSTSNMLMDYTTPQSSINHVYSYAYYEPGAAKCHSNIPQTEIPIPQIPGPSKSPPRNSIRALLAKRFRSKTLSCPPTTSKDKHTYTTCYGTQENLYEEVNEQNIRKVLSDNKISTEKSQNVREELRRVQHNHFRVLDELNLSLEALIMPPTPPDISPTGETASQASQSISHISVENLSSTLNAIELTDHTCINPEFDEGDLDSGISGSGSSSSASYNESFRYYKTGTMMQTTTTLPHMQSCRSSTSKCSVNCEEQCYGGILTTSNTAVASSSSSTSSPFNFVNRSSNSQRSSSSSSTFSGAKPKKNFWTVKK